MYCILTEAVLVLEISRIMKFHRSSDLRVTRVALSIWDFYRGYTLETVCF